MSEGPIDLQTAVMVRGNAQLTGRSFETDTAKAPVMEDGPRNTAGPSVFCPPPALRRGACLLLSQESSYAGGRRPEFERVRSDMSGPPSSCRRELPFPLLEYCGGSDVSAKVPGLLSRSPDSGRFAGAGEITHGQRKPRETGTTKVS